MDMNGQPHAWTALPLGKDLPPLFIEKGIDIYLYVTEVIGVVVVRLAVQVQQMFYFLMILVGLQI